MWRVLRPGTIIPGTPRRTKALPVCHAPGPATHRTDGTPRRHALACFSDSGTGHRSRSRRLRPAAAGQNRAAMIRRPAAARLVTHPHTIPSRKENSAILGLDWAVVRFRGTRLPILLGQSCSNDQFQFRRPRPAAARLVTPPHHPVTPRNL